MTARRQIGHRRAPRLAHRVTSDKRISALGVPLLHEHRRFGAACLMPQETRVYCQEIIPSSTE
jgi:hypothetical protein